MPVETVPIPASAWSGTPPEPVDLSQPAPAGPSIPVLPGTGENTPAATVATVTPVAPPAPTPGTDFLRKDGNLAGIADTGASRLNLGVRSAAEITAEIAAAITALLAGAPGALDTLNELAAALGDDENFAATVTAALAGKEPGLGNPATDGQILTSTAAGVRSWTESNVQFVAKTAPTAKTNDATLGTEAELSCAVLAGKTYSLELFLASDSNDGAAGGIRAALTGPAVTNARVEVEFKRWAGTAQAVAASHALASSTTFTFVYAGGVGSGVTSQQLRFWAIFTASADGIVALQWAQNIAGGNPTNLHRGAWMRLTELS